MSPSEQRVIADSAVPDRRSRLRAWTLQEIKEVALCQLSEHGVDGVSLNAIGKEIGMSGPALYRYIASRDELLVALVIDAWEELADALEQAAASHAGIEAADRLAAIGLAYRAWGKAQPERYKLALSTRMGSGTLAPDRVIPAAQRAMNVVLATLVELPESGQAIELPASLSAELEAWNRRVGGPQAPAPLLLRTVLFWSRLHGLLSLELAQHLSSMALDPELLYRAELERLTAPSAPA